MGGGSRKLGRKVAAGKAELRETGGGRRDPLQELGNELTSATQETSLEGLCASPSARSKLQAWGNAGTAPAHQSHCEEATSVKFLICS